MGLKVKGGLKVKAPKLKLKVKAKPKVAGKLKVGGKAKVGAKAKVGGKAKVGLKVGVKHRRLQAAKPAAKPTTPAKTDIKDGFLPPLPTGDDKKKADDKKPADAPKTSADAPALAVDADGLPVSKYSGDVEVPKDLSGDSDQTAPLTANLVKLCFMLFAALLTMY